MFGIANIAHVFIVAMHITVHPQLAGCNKLLRTIWTLKSRFPVDVSLFMFVQIVLTGKAFPAFIT